MIPRQRPWVEWPRFGRAISVDFVTSAETAVDFPEGAVVYANYQRYGVEEYYLYDPDEHELEGWLRSNGELCEITEMNGWRSPRLGIRFALEGNTLVIYRPDGERFLTYVELAEETQRAQKRAETAEAERERLREQIRALGANPKA